MVRAIYKTIFTMLAAFAFNSTEADLSVVYETVKPNKVLTKEDLVTDLTLIAANFASFRSFEVFTNGLNIIEIANKVGTRIDVGVLMYHKEDIDAQVKAICDAHKLYTNTIRSVLIVSDNLADIKVNYKEIIHYINKVKACTNGEVDVGTVQGTNEWLTVPGAEEIVKVSTINVVDIGPFTTESNLSPIQIVQDQLGKIKAKYGSTEAWMISTGYPTKGESYKGNMASVEIAQEFLDHLIMLSTDMRVTWISLCDSLVSYYASEAEKHYGIYDSTCTVQKLKLPASLNNSSSHSPSSSVKSVGQSVQQSADN